MHWEGGVGFPAWSESRGRGSQSGGRGLHPGRGNLHLRVMGSACRGGWSASRRDRATSVGQWRGSASARGTLPSSRYI